MIFKIIKATTEVIKTQEWEMQKDKATLNNVAAAAANSTALATR